jgi:pyruvate ferredoxin oxidoreductase gamma subunit
MGKILEVRWHGRGGLGAVTSAELIALAVIEQGRHAQSFPSFGPERRGAPVMAFLRISDEFIRMRTNVTEPDIVIVLDPTLLQAVDVASGLKEGGKVVINSSLTPQEVKSKYGFSSSVSTVDAFKIARETIKLPITNTTMIGAFLRVSEALEPSFMENVLSERFGDKAGVNMQAINRGYNETVMED